MVGSTIVNLSTCPPSFLVHRFQQIFSWPTEMANKQNEQRTDSNARPSCCLQNHAEAFPWGLWRNKDRAVPNLAKSSGYRVGDPERPSAAETLHPWLTSSIPYPGPGVGWGWKEGTRESQEGAAVVLGATQKLLPRKIPACSVPREGEGSWGLSYPGWRAALRSAASPARSRNMAGPGRRKQSQVETVGYPWGQRAEALRVQHSAPSPGGDDQGLELAFSCTGSSLGILSGWAPGPKEGTGRQCFAPAYSGSVDDNVGHPSNPSVGIKGQIRILSMRS